MRPALLPLARARGCYVETFPSFRAEVPDPWFVIGPLRDDTRAVSVENRTVPGVGVHRLGGISVTSHGLLLRDGTFLVSPQLNLSEGAIAECAAYGALRADRPPSRTMDAPTVPLAGPGHLIYGHWLSDFLPRLFLLREAGLDPGGLTYLLPSNTPAFAHDLLRAVGIPAGRVATYDPYAETVALADAVIPTLMRAGSRAHPAFARAARFLASSILPVGLPAAGPSSAAGRRLFLSRAAAGRDHERSCVNRDEIEDCARAAGYAVVAPESLGIADQVALFADARRIVGEYGSALHGSIFAPPDARVCALRGNLPHPGFLQSGLCEALGQRLGYVIGDTVLDAGAQRFRVGLEDFRAALAILDGEEAAPRGPPSSVRRVGRALRRGWRLVRTASRLDLAARAPRA